MKKLFVVLLAGMLAVGFSGLSMAQQTDQHSVTITVSSINEINVDNDVSLTINTATAGSEPDDAVDNTTADLLWTTNAANRKIQVSSSAAPTYTLTVEGINETEGTPASAVTISTTDTDFITGVGKTAGQCDLEYTASAPVTTDPGSEVVTVVYTMTNE